VCPLELSVIQRPNSILGNLYFEVKIGKSARRSAVRLIILQVSVATGYMTVSLNNELDLISRVS